MSNSVKPTSEVLQKQKSQGNFSLNNLTAQRMPSDFLVQEDDFLGRLGSIALKSYSPQGLDPTIPIEGVVLYVVDQAPPPEGTTDKANAEGEELILTTKQAWVHTPYDEMCGIPKNWKKASSGGEGAEELYEHYVYEVKDPSLQLKDGDVVEVLHPWAKGFKNTVGQVLRKIADSLPASLTDVKSNYENVNKVFRNIPASTSEGNPCYISEEDADDASKAQQVLKKQMNDCSWARGEIMDPQAELVPIEDEFLISTDTSSNPEWAAKAAGLQVRLDSRAADALKNMMKAMNAADKAGGFLRAELKKKIKLKINYGFRSMNEQTQLWKKHRKPDAPYTTAGGNNIEWAKNPNKSVAVAVPGTSRHQSGVAIDISVSKAVNDYEKAGAQKIYLWLIDYGPKNGWYRTVCSENWHFEWFPQPPPSNRTVNKVVARMQSWELSPGRLRFRNNKIGKSGEPALCKK